MKRSLVLAMAAALAAMFSFVCNAAADGAGWTQGVIVYDTSCIDPHGVAQPVYLPAETMVTVLPGINPEAPDMLIVRLGDGWSCVIDPGSVQPVSTETPEAETPELTETPAAAETAEPAQVDEVVITPETEEVSDVAADTDTEETISPEIISAEPADISAPQGDETSEAVGDAVTITALPSTGTGTDTDASKGGIIDILSDAVTLCVLTLAGGYALFCAGSRLARRAEFRHDRGRHARHCIPRGPH